MGLAAQFTLTVRCPGGLGAADSGPGHWRQGRWPTRCFPGLGRRGEPCWQAGPSEKGQEQGNSRRDTAHIPPPLSLSGFLPGP